MNRRRWFWAAQTGGWTAYGLSTFFTLLPALPADVVGSYLAAKLLRAGVGFTASLLLLHLYRRMLARRLGVPVVLSAAIGAAVILGAVWLLVYRGMIAPALLPEPLPFGLEIFPRAALDLTFVLLTWSAIYFAVLQWERTRVEEHRALEARRFAEDARFQMLSYQVNPHFLFNSLNSIRALIGEDGRKARTMVTEFADFLRYTLKREPMRPATVRDEAGVAANYLAVEAIRFDKQLDFAMDIDPASENCLIPGFLLHPLVENAVKHGMKSDERPLRIRVSARLCEPRLVIEVMNSGRLVDPNVRVTSNGNGTGTGWRNVRGRLQHLYPDDHRFEAQQDGGCVRVRIDLPAVQDVSRAEAKRA